MKKYSSSIVFLSYNNYEYGIQFFEKVLNLKLVMDQGFARVYSINKTSFLGFTKALKEVENHGSTLISLTTDNLESEYNKIKEYDVLNLTPIRRIDQIPLDSFFFNDLEGHFFEFMRFIGEEDVKLFNS